MRWSGATGAIARCKKVSTACGRKRRSVHVLHWICGVKLKPKAVNKLLHYFIVLERDKPGSSATVSPKTARITCERTAVQMLWPLLQESLCNPHPKRNAQSTWGSSSLCTTCASEAKRCLVRSLSYSSHKTLESDKSVCEKFGLEG